MDYEIFLTEKCNRKCEFCYINQTKYIETEKNIEKFISFVKNNSKSQTLYKIYMFGGEPFINYSGIEKIYDNFSHEKNCEIHIITNGDLIEDYMIKKLSNVHLHISTYDIFNSESHKKYLRIYNNFKYCVCLYTLTEKDITKYKDLKNIYNSLGMKHNIHFSHDPDSWKNISNDELYNEIFEIMMYELKIYADNFSNDNPEANNFIHNHIANYIQMLFDKKMKKVYCTSYDKMTFNRGEFIGPCIRLKNKKIGYFGQKCKKCHYFTCCTSGCNAELNPEVDDKLCIIEKSQFDAIEFFLKRPHKNIGRIINFYHNFSKLYNIKDV
jgi:sulfatase maturation enzyme AslB (radical SAM superfamily)